MKYKLIRLLSEDENSPAMKGVPFPTGVEFEIEKPEDKAAAKLLKFIDGSKSLAGLIEDLPLSSQQLGQVVSRLYDLGAIAFDPEYCDMYLVEDDAPLTAPQTAEPQQPAAEGGKAKEETDIEIVEEGNLEEIPLWQSFNKLERKLFTGRVLVVTEQSRREFYFLNGALTFASTDHPEEDIGRLLIEKKKLTQAQYETYKNEMANGGRDPFTLLVELGAFPGHQKLMAQRWWGQNSAFNVMSERKGTFVIEKWNKLPKEVPKLGLNFKGIMTRFMAEKLPVDEEAAKLKEKMNWWLAPITEELERSVTDKEKRLWEILVEKPRRLRDLMTLTTMYKKDTYRFILTLLTSGVVEMVKSPPVEEGPIDLKRLDEIVETALESNYFDVLTVHPVSNDEDIKKSYERALKTLNLSAYRELTEDQKNKLLKMKERVESAWSVLKEEKTRREYRRKTFSEYQLRQYAQLQYQKGEIYLWWRQDPVSANDYFRSSMDLDPQNSLYWAAYGYSILCMPSPDPKSASDAVKLIERVTGLASVDPTACVFAGGALLRIGKRKAAETMFEKAKKSGAESAGITSMISIIVSRDRD